MRRPDWLTPFRCFLFDHGADAFVSALWQAMYDQLRGEGMTSHQAFEIAFRCSRLMVRLLAGQEQQAAAAALGVSHRTAKRDARRLRKLGALWDVGPVPARPWEPTDAAE